MERVLRLARVPSASPPPQAGWRYVILRLAQRLRLRGSVACASEDRVIMLVYSV